MKLKKCSEHGYTLQSRCKVCGKESKEAHYKFIRLRAIDESDEKNRDL